MCFVNQQLTKQNICHVYLDFRPQVNGTQQYNEMRLRLISDICHQRKDYKLLRSLFILSKLKKLNLSGKRNTYSCFLKQRILTVVNSWSQEELYQNRVYYLHIQKYVFLFSILHTKVYFIFLEGFVFHFYIRF